MRSVNSRPARRGRRAARHISAGLALAAAAALSRPALGVTVYTWSGAGTDNLWTDDTNWTPTTGYPGTTSTDVATFGTAGTSNQPLLNASESIGELIFSSASGGWTISDTGGYTLTLNATGSTAGIGINASAQTSGTNTINANINVATTAQTWEVGAGGTLTINGTVTAASGIGLTLGTTTYTGKINLTAADTFSALTIAGTTATLSGTDTFGGAFAQTSGTSNISGNDTFSSTVTLSGGTANISGNETFNNSSGNAALFSGATVNLSGNNTYANANLTVTAGTVNLTGNNTVGTNGTANIVQVGGTINISGANGTLQTAYGSLTSDAFWLENGTLELNNSTSAASYRLGPSSSSPYTVAINEQGGEAIILVGNSTTPVNEYVSAINLVNASTTANISSFGAYPTFGIPLLTVTNGNTTASNTTFTIGQINWSDGNNPLFVNGVNLGASNGGQIIDSALAGGGGTPGTPNQPIVPYLLGEAASGYGTATGTPNTFVTYNGNGVLRPLDPTTEFTNNSVINGNNTYITAATTASSSATINSLVINGGDLTIADGQTIANSSGTLLFVAGSTAHGIQRASATDSNPGTYQLSGSSSALITVNGNAGASGTSPQYIAPINVPISGSANITDAGNGILQLGASSPNFTGQIWINGTVEIGNGSSSNYDGNIPNASAIYLNNNGSGPLSYTQGGTFVVNDVNSTVINASINFPASGYANLYTESPSNVTFNGSLNLNSPPNGAPFIFLYGNTLNGTYQGSVTFNGTISQPDGANDVGSEYFYDAVPTLTVNSQITQGYPKYYMMAIPYTNLYGPTPATVTGMVLNSNGQVGPAFSGSGATATPGTGSGITGFIATDMNRLNQAATTMPPSVTVNQNGTINTGSGSTIWDAYYAGGVAWYANADIAAGTSLGIEYNSHGDGATGAIGAMYVAPNVLVTIAPFSSDTQTGFFVVGYGNYSTDVGVNTGYLSLGSGSIVDDNGTANSAYFGLESNAQVDMLPTTPGNGSAMNIWYLLYIDSGGFSGVQDTVNVGANDTLTIGNFNSNGTTAGGPGSGKAGILLNATDTIYATAVMTVAGGTVNNVNSSSSFTTGNANVYLSLFGNGTLDNHSISPTSPASPGSLSPGIVNVGSYASASAGGTLRTGSIAAETISSTISSTAYPGANNAYVNFNGGELDYNGTNALSSVQNAFINYGVNSVFINQGGAKIGTTYSSSGYTTNAIESQLPLLAPPGKGITTISVTSGGSGYIAPPQVEISDSQGFDASAYAVVDTNPSDANFGQVISIVVTDPGFNMSNPTIALVGGGGSGAAVSATLAANDAFLNSGNFSTTSAGGLTKVAAGTLELQGTYEGLGSSTKTADYSYTTTGTFANVVSGVAPAGAATGANLGNDPAVGSGNAGNYIRNNTSTYTGPTVIQTGTLALITATSPSVTGATGTVTTFPATNNNIPYSSMIVVGDTPADSGAVFQVYGVTGTSSSGIGATGGFELAPVLSASAGQQIGQILSGFGTVSGSSNVGLTIGLASTGNNFGQASTYSGSNNSMISPGYTPNVGTTAGGTPMGQTYQGFMFNTAQGGAAGARTPQTGALTITGSANSSAMTTTFGSGGEYYWKVNLATASGGATSTPGNPSITNPSSTLTTSNAAVTGAAWDALVVDTLAVPASGTPFTIQAVGFGSQTGVTIGGSNTQDYSWVIAHAADASITANLLANLSLNTTGMPAPATGYGYYLSADTDPTSGSDLVINYAPVPEPAALALLAPAAGAMLLRRRRKTGAARAV